MRNPKSILKIVPYAEAVELLKKLVSVNTVNPPGNEKILAPIIKEAFDDIGAKMKVVEKQRGRANFVGKIGSGSPSVGFFPHLDTVPPGDGWNTNPFSPTVKNGKLYARGAVDSKGNFASSWAAIKTFLRLRKKFNGTIYLVGCADEETGSKYGVEHLLKEGFKVDYAIVPDGGYIDKIMIGEKGIIRIKIKSYGVQAHGSSPELGVNAIEHLIRLLEEIRGLSFEDFSFHESFSGITKNIGVIKGGHAVNIVPAYAEAEIDIRFPLGVDRKKIILAIHKKEQELRSKEKTARFEIEETFGVDPHLTNANSPLINAFLKSSREFSMKMRVGTMGGVTDAKPLSLAGIDTLVHSLDDGSERAHNANEYVRLENIRIAAALYASTLAKIF